MTRVRGPGRRGGPWIAQLGVVLALGCGGDVERESLPEEAAADSTVAGVRAGGGPGGGDPGTGGPDAPDPLADARRALEADNPNLRVRAAVELVERQDLPAPVRAELLLDALASEIDTPAPGAPLPGSYLTQTERLRQTYTRALGRLAVETPETLRESTEADGELRARTVLALGYGGHAEAVPDLRDLLRGSDVGRVRASAANLLGQLGAEEAVPDLLAALDDPYQGQVEGLDGRVRTLHPVRDQAFGALRALGVAVEPLGDGRYRVPPS